MTERINSFGFMCFFYVYDGDPVDRSLVVRYDEQNERRRQMKKKIEDILQEQKETAGVHEYAFLAASDISFSDDVRTICEGNGCGLYNTSWACPPAVGTVAECKARYQAFADALVMTTVTELEDKYDFEKWIEAGVRHEAVTDAVARIVEDNATSSLVLSTEGCKICNSCTYPDQPCRFPNRMHPATEGYGIMVTELAKRGGIAYNNGTNSITFFSVIFFNRKPLFH
ncbi:MAG: DUF2284 domain-containing protein [Lachnospiraceae bacterium]